MMEYRSGQPEFQEAISRLYRATPTAVGGRPARYERATPAGRARSVGARRSPTRTLRPAKPRCWGHLNKSGAGVGDNLLLQLPNPESSS